jgi:hypothetical protein
MPPSDVNWVAILVAAIAGFAIGGLWYTALFGKRWRRLAGVEHEELRTGAAAAYGLGFVCTFVMAYTMSRFVDYVFDPQHEKTLGHGLVLALMIWLGFVATTGLTNDLFGRKPVSQWMIESAHHLAALLAMGAILTCWQ